MEYRDPEAVRVAAHRHAESEIARAPADLRCPRPGSLPVRQTDHASKSDL